MKQVATTGFVIRRFPYQESSLLLDYLTQTHGIVRLIAKGAKRNKQLQLKTEPFIEIQFEFNPAHDLPILKKAELGQELFRLKGEALWCGLYMNEVLLKLFEPRYADEEIFLAYTTALRQLSCEQHHALALRQFELQLLNSLGYRVLEATTSPQTFYCFVPEKGLMSCHPDFPHAISGESLEKIRQNNWDKVVLSQSKGLFSKMIEQLLGDKKLRVKETFSKIAS